MEISSELATIIAASIAALASCITFFLGKRHEMRIELRKIKEQQYIDFLTSLARAKSCDEGLDKINEELSVKVQTIYLVGNKNVQIKLTSFLNIFLNGTDQLTQSKLYGELIQAMKIDLYGKKWKITIKQDNSLDEIKFIVFKNESK